MPLRNLWGTQADSVSGQAVTNARASECIYNWMAQARMGSVILTARRPFAQDAELDTAWFTVAASGGPVTVTGAAYSPDDRRELKLTLSRDIAPDETATVSYRRPRGKAGLWDVDGRQLADIGPEPVAKASVPVSATAVAVVSEPGDDATYAAGDSVRVAVTFTEAVDVDTEAGTPRLKLDLGGGDGAGERWAAWEGGSGTDTLTFAWTAAAPDEAADGIAVLADTLETGGGTIRSVATQADAALGHAGLAHDPAHKVDAAPPQLLRGEIDGGAMTLHFSEALDPDSTGGEFHMAVETPERGVVGFRALGGVTVDGATVTVGMGAGYPRATAGLERNWVRYVRRADGGGALRDLAGNPVTAPHRMGSTNGVESRYIKIDLENVTRSVPLVTGVAVVSDAGGDDTYAIGETIRVQVTFGETVSVDTSGGTPRLRIRMDPRWGEFWAAYESGGGTEALTFAYTVAEPNTSPPGIAVLANTLQLNGGAIRSVADGQECAPRARGARPRRGPQGELAACAVGRDRRGGGLGRGRRRHLRAGRDDPGAGHLRRDGERG